MLSNKAEVIEISEDITGVKVTLPTYIRRNPLNSFEFVDDELMRFLDRAGKERHYDLDFSSLISVAIVLTLGENNEDVTFIHKSLIEQITQLILKKGFIIDTNFLQYPKYLEQEHALLFEVAEIH